MRAGNLDRLIKIQRRETDVKTNGTPIERWQIIAEMRAQLLKNAVDDREDARGRTTDVVLTFRMYYFPDLSLNDRLQYDGQQYEVKQITEIGRRIGMDVTCERVGP